MQDLEEDVEMRTRINLYRDPEAAGAGAGAAAAPRPAGVMEEGSDEDEEGDVLPQIPLEELLDDLEALGLEGEEEEEGQDGGSDAMMD